MRFGFAHKDDLFVGGTVAREGIFDLHDLVENSLRTARLAFDQTLHRIGIAQHVFGGDLCDLASCFVQILLLAFGELRVAFFLFKQCFQLLLGSICVLAKIPTINKVIDRLRVNTIIARQMINKGNM